MQTPAAHPADHPCRLTDAPPYEPLALRDTASVEPGTYELSQPSASVVAERAGRDRACRGHLLRWGQRRPARRRMSART
jgi:hypothetical protein